MTAKTDLLLKQIFLFAIFAILGFCCTYVGYNGWQLYNYTVSITNISNLSISLSDISFKLTVTFKNPSDLDFNLASYTLNVAVNGIAAGTTTYSTPQYIAPGASTNVDIDVNMPLSGALSSLFSAANANYKNALVTVTGTASFTSGPVTINNYAVNTSETIADLMS